MNGKELSELSDAVRQEIAVPLDDSSLKAVVPKLAKNPRALAKIDRLVGQVATRHELLQGDARRLDAIATNSVSLVLTSPPYWTLKEYVGSAGQLGDVTDYQEFVTELGRVWKQCLRVLQPGGRLVIVVGDVCQSRKSAGRHSVMPLHASIIEKCREFGFDMLAPIIWNKISNARFEVAAGGGFLGKPYEPNAVVKNDIEYILMARKPGGYRRPTPAARLLSIISEVDHHEWFQQIWRLTGASTKDHPAPFPLQLAERIVRMFCFVGDTVLDPFVGTGTTMLAAARWGRSSIGLDIEPAYIKYAARRLTREMNSLLSGATLVLKHSSSAVNEGALFE